MNVGKKLVVATAFLWSGVAMAASLDSRLEEARKKLDDAARELAQVHKALYADKYGKDKSAGDRAMLGILVDMDGAKSGVYVTGVTPKTGAAAAGLKAKDLIVALDSTRLDTGTASALRLMEKYMATITPGAVVQVEFVRRGTSSQVDVVTHAKRGHIVEIMEHHDDHDYEFELTDDGDPTSHIVGGGGLVGTNLVPINAELAHYFKVDEGVLVAQAPKDSGLLAGDVLLEINGEAVASEIQARRALFAGSGKPMVALIQRRGDKTKVDVSANVLTLKSAGDDAADVRVIRVKKLCEQCDATDEP